jgi:hypothetical protein
VPAGELVILPDHVRQPLGDGEAFVFAVGDRFEKPRAHVCQSKSAIQPRWVPKQALQDHAAVARLPRLVHGKFQPVIALNESTTLLRPSGFVASCANQQPPKSR